MTNELTWSKKFLFIFCSVFLSNEYCRFDQLLNHLRSQLTSFGVFVLLSFLVNIFIIISFFFQTPQTWQDRWEGPTDPMQYLRAVISKAKAMQQLTSLTRDRELFSQTINLSDLFRPDTFLNAFRQQTARETKQPMDTLVLNTSWSGEVKHSKNNSIKISGLQLEGCSFDGGRLNESAPDSPSVTAFPPCYIAWIPRVNRRERERKPI